MTEVSHRTCPFCGHNECFGYNTDTGQFFCFSCEAKPSNKGCLIFDGVTRAPFTETFEEEGYCLEPYYRDYRGISKETLEEYGAYFTKITVEEAISQEKSKKGSNKERIEWLESLSQEYIETVHYTYPEATKHRELPKTIKVSGKLNKFYGQDDYTGGKFITITEGEEDRLSAIEMLGDFPVVSVPNASPSKEFWSNAKDYLGAFDSIVLSVDKDAAGQALADKFYRLFPGKVYLVDHGKYKDANDFLQAGEKYAYKQAWWNKQKIKPDGILCTRDDFLKLYNDTPNFEYYETGIPALDEKILGIHKGFFTLILAPTGIGKTEFMRYLEWKLLSTTEYTLAVCHLEETQLRSLLGLVSYDLKDNLTRKDLVEEKGREGEVKESLTKLADSERLITFQFSLNDTVDDIVDKVRFLVTAMEVDFIFIEPIQDLVSGDLTTKESLLTDLGNKFKRLAPEINCGIVVIGHTNDEGEVKYCKSLKQSAAFEIKLERDMEAESISDRNRTDIRIGSKNRTGNGSGPAGSVYFDLETYSISPELTVNYSKTEEQEIPF